MLKRQFRKVKKIKLLKADGLYENYYDGKNILTESSQLRGTPDIKIITGIRRSGKSKLMQAYMEYLKSHLEDINIIFIDFMDLAYEEVKEYHALHSVCRGTLSRPGKANYLFVDEVQMCPHFELAINSLYSKGQI